MSIFLDTFTRTTSSDIGDAVNYSGSYGWPDAYVNGSELRVLVERYSQWNWLAAPTDVEALYGFDFFVGPNTDTDLFYRIDTRKDADGYATFLYVGYFSSGTWEVQAGFGDAYLNFGVSPNTYYTVRMEFSHEIRRIKVWERGSPEPDWMAQDVPDPVVGTWNPYLAVSAGAEVEGRLDNLLVDVIPTGGGGGGGGVITVPPQDIHILYDGQDITDYVVIADSSFTSRSDGSPGDAEVVVRDKFQELEYAPGKTLELFIDGEREWDGWVVTRRRTYWFDGHDANCYPCPHVTPRRFVLLGADRNYLFTRRILHDATNPALPEPNVYPAGTADDYVLNNTITNYLDPTDGIDWSSKIENVGSPDPYQEFRIPGSSDELGELFRKVAMGTGATFFIDPDRYAIYTDVNTETAPFALSDQPDGEAGEIGYREMTILRRADEMVNDALIWGAGQGSNQIVFHRTTDTDSIGAHGRWQNSGGFRQNLYEPLSLKRTADSIVYGSPSSHRGHKDDRVSVSCTIFHPGLRPAHKVSFTSLTHGFTDVIPVREIRVSFISPQYARWDVRLSHEIDQPWTSSEYWWPDDQPPQGPVCPSINCVFPTYESGGLALGPNVTPPADLKDSHVVRLGGMYQSVNIVAGPTNVFQYWNDNLLTCSDGIKYGSYPSYLECIYRVDYTDWVAYTGILSTYRYAIYQEGERQETWETGYTRNTAGRNATIPGGGVVARIYGAIYLNGSDTDRLKNDFIGCAPHRLQVSILRPRKDCFDVRSVGSVIVEIGGAENGGNYPFETHVNFEDNEPWFISIQIMEINQQQAVTNVTAGMDFFVEYRDRLPAGGVLIGDGDGDPCLPISLCGAVCVTPVHQDAGLYRLPVGYIPGSTRVWVDGIHQIPGVQYTESDPGRGLIEFVGEPSGQVYMCFDASGYADRVLPDTATSLFILPVAGSITGTFGVQQDLWPPMVWHGTFYEHFHNGVDFGVPTGTAVYAAADGVVRWEDQAAGGTMIHIYHSNGMRTTYAHLSGRIAQDGDTVSQGELIALSGASGQVTGAHLHWGMTYLGSPEDPLPYVSGYTTHATTPITVVS